MSPQNSAAQQLASGAAEEKPRFNIYTMMLIISLLAIIMACFLLWYELKSYGPFPQWKTGNVAPSTAMRIIPDWEQGPLGQPLRILQT